MEASSWRVQAGHEHSGIESPVLGHFAEEDTGAPLPFRLVV
jgi:hypothetical protein